MRNVHVFLSYVDEDRKPAEALIEELQEHGIKWFSYLHVPRLLGTNARMKIAHAIQGAHFVVILWSRHTTSSSWVLDELRHAMSTGKPILPVLLDEGVPLPPPLDQLEAERGFDNPAAWKMFLFVLHEGEICVARKEAAIKDQHLMYYYLIQINLTGLSG
jgi:hypothetical protein